MSSGNDQGDRMLLEWIAELKFKQEAARQSIRHWRMVEERARSEGENALVMLRQWMEEEKAAEAQLKSAFSRGN